MDGRVRHRQAAKAAFVPVTGKSSEEVDASTGQAQNSFGWQLFRLILLGFYELIACSCLHFVQFLAAPLYFWNKPLYYTFQSLVKSYFILLLAQITSIWAPVKVRISASASISPQLHLSKDGILRSDFPSRLVLIANHQIYTDWIYLWWIAYTSGTQGHFFIILKESLRYLPIIGPGMMFMSFIFLSRKWTTDKPRFRYRLQKLNARMLFSPRKTALSTVLEDLRSAITSTPPPAPPPKSVTEAKTSAELADELKQQDSTTLDPMWLLLFPEGTNLSPNARRTSARWAAKQGREDLKHTVLPRSTGLLYCLQELQGTVDWVYDCTVGYSGVRTGDFAADMYGIWRNYGEGRAPEYIDMYWRGWKVKDIPLNDEKAFGDWLTKRWEEKDALLEIYQTTGKFPPSEEPIGLNGSAREESEMVKTRAGWIETEIKPTHPLEIVQIFMPVVVLCLVWYWIVGLKNWSLKLLGLKTG
ncbi:acyltransferase-domain-containing protein [Eremomyces bilateralis CBS 781.70]|uniref:Acyltransferase-domain-containing protein n=1 Tax=Eremomyces bilateralis CBS 781.70 TaxID=1392243 RepID=A0A6G1G561_9PEZI|nr:acyltransferase-domain-containing protein [Eremomyces bilateralis CBS 781.70]KAF1813142.1 acyltransferase-domain-containing protein [Eremomyces bilateralis CBS 781.70]